MLERRPGCCAGPRGSRRRRRERQKGGGGSMRASPAAACGVCCRRRRPRDGRRRCEVVVGVVVVVVVVGGVEGFVGGQGPGPVAGVGFGEGFDDAGWFDDVAGAGAGGDVEPARGGLGDPPAALVLGAVVVAAPHPAVPRHARPAQGVVEGVVEVAGIRRAPAARRHAVPVADPHPPVHLGAGTSPPRRAGVAAWSGGLPGGGRVVAGTGRVAGRVGGRGRVGVGVRAASGPTRRDRRG